MTPSLGVLCSQNSGKDVWIYCAVKDVKKQVKKPDGDTQRMSEVWERPEYSDSAPIELGCMPPWHGDVFTKKKCCVPLCISPLTGWPGSMGQHTGVAEQQHRWDHGL